MSLHEESLKTLLEDCKSQINVFHNTKINPGSSSCDEIIRRAVTDDGSEALSILLHELSIKYIKNSCPRDLRVHMDDFIQETQLRLLRKLSDKKSPFRPRGFPAYRIYLALTGKTAAEYLRRILLSPYEIPQPLPEPPLPPSPESDYSFEDLLNRITNPLAREVVRMRYEDDTSYNEIVEILQPLHPELTKKKAYKLVENALKQIRASLGIDV